MPKPLILYSTNTRLAFNISENYYGGVHFVYCTRFFDKGSLLYYGPTHLPPTSSPGEIYHTLSEAVRARDKHCPKIGQNRAGIIKGATIKRKTRIITKEQEKDIFAIVYDEEIVDFKPMLYVIGNVL